MGHQPEGWVPYFPPKPWYRPKRPATSSKDTSPLPDELTNIQRREVEILETIRDIPHCAICKVKIRGVIYAMKVYHAWADNSSGGKDFFETESSAYRVLKRNKFCARGVVPDFHGVITDMDPSEWPDWQIFHRENEPPLPANAILMEYIDDMEFIKPSIYTPERGARLSQIMDEFHGIGFRHGDCYPRNMITVPGRGDAKDRVLWIDFELSKLVDLDSMDAHENELLQEEREVMNQFVQSIAIDFENGGKINETSMWYYEW